MGRNWYLACPEIKKYVWVGQGENGSGYMSIFYSGEQDVMNILTVFLNMTKGKNLILVDEHDENDFTGFSKEESETYLLGDL